MYCMDVHDQELVRGIRIKRRMWRETLETCGQTGAWLCVCVCVCVYERPKGSQLHCIVDVY